MTIRSWQQQVMGLLGWLLLSFAVAALGASATIQAQAFYTQLSQPAWAPPSALFGPVWTVLYVMMAVAAWLVWRQHGLRTNPIALSLFLAQLALNGLWSWLFFAWQSGTLALVNIGVLWLLIVATIVYFWQVRVLAGALLIPYLLWVSFAAALNYSLLQLNPLILG